MKIEYTYIYVRLLLTLYRIFFCLSSSFFLKKENEGRAEKDRIIEANIKLFERLLRDAKKCTKFLSSYFWITNWSFFSR